jgi:hypothetical protein
MRFPRIVRVRSDKTPAQADTLENAHALLQAQIASGHREEAAPRGRRAKSPMGKKKTKKETRQLSLFSDDD